MSIAMKKLVFFLVFVWLLSSEFAFSQSDKAQWISSSEVVDSSNTWLAFRKVVQLKKKPIKALAKIAVDSKYWLFIN